MPASLLYISVMDA